MTIILEVSEETGKAAEHLEDALAEFERSGRTDAYAGLCATNAQRDFVALMNKDLQRNPTYSVKVQRQGP